MKRKELGIIMIQGIIEYAIFIPITLLIGTFLHHSLSLWGWFGSTLLLFFFGMIYRTMWPDQKWWMYAGLSIVVSIITSIILVGPSLLWIVAAVIYPVFSYRGMMYATRSWKQLLPITFMWYGTFVIYFVSYLFFRYFEKLQPYSNIITISGIITIVLILFVSNNENLKASTLSKQKKPFVSRTIKTQNRVYLTLTLIVIFLIANGKFIQEALIRSLRAIITFMLGLFDGEALEPIPEETSSNTSMGMGELEHSEPSWFAKLIETILIYGFYIVFTIAVIMLILSTIKKTRIWLKQMIRRFINFLQQIVSRKQEGAEATGYIDEKESIFDWQEWKKETQNKAKGLVQNIFKREPRWESLSNQEKVRYVYKQFLTKRLKGINYKAAQTPRETLAEISTSQAINERDLEKLRNAYEITRYGERDLDDHTIQDIRSFIKDK